MVLQVKKSADILLYLWTVEFAL